MMMTFGKSISGPLLEIVSLNKSNLVFQEYKQNKDKYQWLNVFGKTNKRDYNIIVIVLLKAYCGGSKRSYSESKSEGG